ncbi:MAG: GNAT family N-acetyltransferase [Promethearchaeota archaeon]
MKYRNIGLASSLISSVLKDIFKEKEEYLITVRVENDPAVHTYKILGFSICSIQYNFENE